MQFICVVTNSYTPGFLKKYDQHFLHGMKLDEWRFFVNRATY